MIIGVLSDTHQDKMNALPHVMREFKNRKVELIIHCGDIDEKHINPDLFLGLPVILAITEDDIKSGKPVFKNSPSGWVYTFPKDRVRYIQNARLGVYVGHRRSFDFLTGSEEELMQTIHEIRKQHDSIRWLFSGHTHHQIYCQTKLANFINPGAIEYSFDGYEFSVIDTETNEVVFSRIPATKPTIQPFSIGIISDSANISELDPDFWRKLAEEFKKRNVGWIVHCGNIKTDDIGKEEFEGLDVYYNLHKNQRKKPGPERWRLIDPENPVFEINGYRFYVQHDLGATLLGESEIGMHRLCLKLRQKYPDLSFVFCGLTNNAFLEEGEQIRIVNPGDIIRDRNFAVVCLPRTEITFGHVPVDPLPPLDSLD